jgi:hypothetical protein
MASPFTNDEGQPNLISMEDVKKSVDDVKQIAKTAFVVGVYESKEDNALGRTEEQSQEMISTRKRNFSQKMGIIDPHYGKKAVGVLAAGTVIGLAATIVPGVGAALGPAVGSAIIASGLAAIEVNAHNQVGDHAILDSLLADQSDDWKQYQDVTPTPNTLVNRSFGLDDIEWSDDDDDEDDSGVGMGNDDQVVVPEEDLDEFLRKQRAKKQQHKLQQEQQQQQQQRHQQEALFQQQQSLLQEQVQFAPVVAQGGNDFFSFGTSPASLSPSSTSPVSISNSLSASSISGDDDDDPFAELYNRKSSSGR